MDDYGISVRLRSLLHPRSGRTLILALDAPLFAGPRGALNDAPGFIEELWSECAGSVQAILAHPGFHCHFVSPTIRFGRIINATGSTTLDDERDKTQTTTVANAIRLAADAIGIHLSLHHGNAPQMLSQAGRLVAEARSHSMPTLIASYVAGVDPIHRPDTVAHAAAVARDLGSSLVKVPFTGTVDSFRRVVDSARPARVVAAGGEAMTRDVALKTVEMVVEAGAAGICYGRTIFESHEPFKLITDLANLLHG